MSYTREHKLYSALPHATYHLLECITCAIYPKNCTLSMGVNILKTKRYIGMYMISNFFQIHIILAQGPSEIECLPSGYAYANQSGQAPPL